MFPLGASETAVGSGMLRAPSLLFARHMHAPARVRPAVRLRRLLRNLHRWLGLIVGLQVLCWVAGGLVMSALRLEEVRGEHVATQAPHAAMDLSAGLQPLDRLLAEHRLDEVHSVSLTSWLDRLVYRVQTAAGTHLFDARNGAPLSPLTEAHARAVALVDYAGPGQLAGLDWVDTPAIEYRGRELPLWRARFADEYDTTLYISPQTGVIVARRNDLWRIFDFVWMLHIMDYEERENFNHPLLIATAASAFLFVLTGLIMLLYSFRVIGHSRPLDA